MPGHSVRALVCGVLLVPLAWIGIVLMDKFRGSSALLPIIVIWGLVLLADLAIAIVSLGRARQHRLQRTPEPKFGRR